MGLHIELLSGVWAWDDDDGDDDDGGNGGDGGDGGDYKGDHTWYLSFFYTDKILGE